MAFMKDVPSSKAQSMEKVTQQGMWLVVMRESFCPCMILVVVVGMELEVPDMARNMFTVPAFIICAASITFSLAICLGMKRPHRIYPMFLRVVSSDIWLHQIRRLGPASPQNRHFLRLKSVQVVSLNQPVYCGGIPPSNGSATYFRYCQTIHHHRLRRHQHE